MKKSGKTNRFEHTDTSWANDFPECVALFKRAGWFSFFENITGFNLEEASSKRSPKNKKRCIVMICFFLFLSLQLSVDHELMEMNIRKKRGFC